MKTKVNKEWFNQYVKELKNGIKEEIRVVKMQRDRYFNYPTEFDVKTNIPKEKIKTYLDNAVDKLGYSEKKLKEILKKYEPCSDLKPDFKAIEEYVKKIAPKVNKTFNIKSKYDVYSVISDFFCNHKWNLPQSEKNNDRIFKIVGKYCEIY